MKNPPSCGTAHFHPDERLDGYDTVAYFTIGEAVTGSPAYTVTWRGASWRFSSKTNMKKFRADPEKFAPAFGGYCSFAVAEGMTVSCDPKINRLLPLPGDITESWANPLHGA